MKKLLVVLFALGLAEGVTAQPKINGAFRSGSLGRGINSGGNNKSNVTVVRPRVTVIAPYSRYNPYFGYGLGYSRFSPYYSPFNSPFHDPFYGSQMRDSKPSQLDLQIEDIKNEYDFKISEAKKDKSLSKDERKQQVRILKNQRENEIIDTKKKYYKDEDDNSENES